MIQQHENLGNQAPPNRTNTKQRYDAPRCLLCRVFEGQKGSGCFVLQGGFDAGRLWSHSSGRSDCRLRKIGVMARAEEARERVNRLRLENFIWEN
jgi:hypothetical protein